MKYSCPCPICGDIRYFVEPVRTRNKKAKCRKCVSKYGNRNSCNLHTRTCKECGKNETNQRKFTSDTCQECSRRLVAKVMVKCRTPESYGEAKSYTYFCRHCSSVRTLKAKRKSANCSDCARSFGKHEHKNTSYFDFKEMKMIKVDTRFFRICKHCGDTKQVKQASLGGIKSCKAHAHLDFDKKEMEKKRKATRKANGTTIGRKKTKKKSTHVSKEAIEKQRQINKEHRERLEAEKRESIPKPNMSEEDMIQSFLATNKPSVVIDENEKIPHYAGKMTLRTSESGAIL